MATVEENFTFKQFEQCRSLFQFLDKHFDDYIEELIRICEIPAPTFEEEKRAEYYARLFQKMGYKANIDDAGNVEIPIHKNGKPRMVLSAHLDTVFPFDEIRVKREGSLLRAPGISDDSSGLAAMYILARAFHETKYPVRGSLTLLATVGEEGLGNLRGVKHFFERIGEKVDLFISLDGCDSERLVTSGLASKRIRVFFRGPGGHSWGDAGTPNPIHASGEFLSRIHRLVLPPNPKTAINVGVISGGTSINAIPTEVSMDIDMRSESADSLKALDELVHKAIGECTYNNGTIATESKILGERPSGSISPEHDLVRVSLASNRQFSMQAKLDVGSTDSNIPFSLGIPAITLGVGGRSGKIHTPEEWYDVKGADKGLKRTALLLAELLNS
ncbi:MAG TPA: M20/M25/M40 family metallo-hydrolase [Acidobacteriota bacterium]|nr:M20/M25/M40 family metallo-hydrolase [Acidobacteriota bacterium]